MLQKGTRRNPIEEEGTVLKRAPPEEGSRSQDVHETNDHGAQAQVLGVLGILREVCHAGIL